MPDPNDYILGFNPGGGNERKDFGNFGWSICCRVHGILQPPPETGLARNAWDAINQVRVRIPDNSRVLAAGIDAPLFWSRTGNRRVDNVLRNKLKTEEFPARQVSGTVQAVNSLQSACTVQGMLLAKYLSETWSLTITEPHPVALQWLLPLLGEFDVANMVRHLTAGLVDHELDATLSAVSAWAAIQPNLPNWQNLYVEEPHPIQPFNIPVSYWMPTGR